MLLFILFLLFASCKTPTNTTQSAKQTQNGAGNIQAGGNVNINPVNPSPTSIPLPPNATLLPNSSIGALKMVISKIYWSPILGEIENTIQDTKILSRTTRIKQYSGGIRKNVGMFDITFTGLATDEEIQLKNHFPVKLLKFTPLTKTLNLLGSYAGGAPDVYSVSIELNSKKQNQIFYATFNPQEVRQQLIKNPDPKIKKELSQQIIKIIDGNTKDIPETFFLKKDENLVIQFALFFAEPGIYEVQFGADYIYRSHSIQAFIEQSLIIVHPENYNIWLDDLKDERFYLFSYSCNKEKKC